MIWNEIINDNDIQHLNEIYNYFEDSMLIRMEYISGDYVDSELTGHMKQRNNLKAVFQRLDHDPFSIELLFTHTKRLSFVFVNPSDKCLSDIMYAKVCKSDKSVFWTLWKNFDPYNEEHLSVSDLTLIEADSMKWRIVSDKSVCD